jgi:hypothetical protein
MLSLLGALCVTRPATAQDDSLAEQARQSRKGKVTTQKHIYDNDNLPREDKLSIVGNAQPAPDAAAPASPSPATAEATDKAPASHPAVDPAATAKSEAERKQAEWQQWKERIVGQIAQIDLAQRELDVTDREYKLRMAALYADVGNRLRNSGQWDKQDQDYKQQMETKRKALEDAKQKLEEMQEQARKAGVPASMREP